ncbi:Zonadhesin, partial [Nosema granulosis]
KEPESEIPEGSNVPEVKTTEPTEQPSIDVSEGKSIETKEPESEIPEVKTTEPTEQPSIDVSEGKSIETKEPESEIPEGSNVPEVKTTVPTEQQIPEVTEGKTTEQPSIETKEPVSEVPVAKTIEPTEQPRIDIPEGSTSVTKSPTAEEEQLTTEETGEDTIRTNFIDVVRNGFALRLKDLQNTKYKFNKEDLLNFRNVTEILKERNGVTTKEQFHMFFSIVFMITELINNENYNKAMIDVLISMLDSSDEYIKQAKEVSSNMENKFEYDSQQYLSVKENNGEKIKNYLSKENFLAKMMNFFDKSKNVNELNGLFSKEKEWLEISDKFVEQLSFTEEENADYLKFIFEKLEFLNSINLAENDKKLIDNCTNILLESFEKQNNVEDDSGSSPTEDIKNKENEIIKNNSEMFVKFIFFEVIPFFSQ